jgi:hypothetical protein
MRNNDPSLVALSRDEEDGYVCLKTLHKDPSYAGQLAGELLIAGNTTPGASACIDTVTRESGDGWRRKAEADIKKIHAEAAEKAKKAGYNERLSGKIEREFYAQCGVEARLESSRQLVLSHPSKKHTLFASLQNPEGDDVKVFCDGRLVFSSPSGARSTVGARIDPDIAEAVKDRACVFACAKSHAVCRSVPHPYLGDVQANRCLRACEAQCR